MSHGWTNTINCHIDPPQIEILFFFKEQQREHAELVRLVAQSRVILRSEDERFAISNPVPAVSSFPAWPVLIL